MKHVLVVEDEPSIREVIREVLELEGYVVSTAANGVEGVQVLRTAESSPDLILLDLNMPEMNGWEFLAARALDPRASRVPVVVLTAAKLIAKPAGADEWCTKPLELESLLAVAERYCAPVAETA